jgi:hypothetical protein
MFTVYYRQNGYASFHNFKGPKRNTEFAEWLRRSSLSSPVTVDHISLGRSVPNDAAMRDWYAAQRV